MSGILGQIAPTGGSFFDLYTCPVNTVATMRVIITNRGGPDTSFRVAISENGDPVADLHSIAFDKPIQGNDTGSTIGFAVSGGDIVRVFAGNSNLSFTATGEERDD